MTTRRGTAVLAAVLALGGLACVGLSLALAIADIATNGLATPDAYGPATLVTGASFPITGWIIASRRPGNAIGWIFLVIGLSQGLSSVTGTLTAALRQLGPTTPFGPEIGWLASWVFAPGFVLMITLSALLFPDGRPPSPRWRPVVWLVLGSIALIVVPIAIWGWPVREAAFAGRGIDGIPGAPAVQSLVEIGFYAALVAAALSIVGMLLRFRRARGVERRQLKWFTFAGAVLLSYGAAIAFLPDLFPGGQWLMGLAAVGVAPLVPLAATVAILRYRLYEIDRIVSRTLAWAIVTGVLVGVFAVLVVGLEALLAGVTQAQTLAVAASTLAAFALFQPVRGRVQRAVDRRFDRARYDGELTVQALGSRLRDEVDLGRIQGDVVTTANEAIRPRTIGLWLRDSGSS